MKTLYLVRHAKSSWEDPGQHDYDRPLTKEGAETAQKVAEYLKKNKIHIKNIVTSSAKRAHSTAEIFAKELSINTKNLIVIERLYKADTPEFEETIYTLPQDWDHAMMVSHNPGISNFIRSFTELDEDIPTSGTVSLTFNTNAWTDINLHKPVVNFILHPKKLKIS